MTVKQRQYLSDLIRKHPNFLEFVGWDTDALESDMVEWLNDTYAHKYTKWLKKLDDLDDEEATGLITHLEYGHKERQAPFQGRSTPK